MGLQPYLVAILQRDLVFTKDSITPPSVLARIFLCNNHHQSDRHFCDFRLNIATSVASGGNGYAGCTPFTPSPSNSDPCESPTTPRPHGSVGGAGWLGFGGGVGSSGVRASISSTNHHIGGDAGHQSLTPPPHHQHLSSLGNLCNSTQKAFCTF